MAKEVTFNQPSTALWPQISDTDVLRSAAISRTNKKQCGISDTAKAVKYSLFLPYVGLLERGLTCDAQHQQAVVQALMGRVFLNVQHRGEVERPTAANIWEEIRFTMKITHMH